MASEPNGKTRSSRPRGRRVVFTFDERSFTNLNRMTQLGRYPSMAEVVREALQVRDAIQKQASEGFSEVVVRNPKTKLERILILPSPQPEP